MLDWQEMLLQQQQDMFAYVHLGYTVPDHPLRNDILLDMLENDDVTDPQATFTHTVGNAMKGMPDFLIVNADYSGAERLIDLVSSAYPTPEEIEKVVGQAIVIDGHLIYLQPVNEADLHIFGEAVNSLLAAQIITASHHEETRWLQIVYPDRNNRLPWDPGVDRGMFQPVVSSRMVPAQGGRLLS